MQQWGECGLLSLPEVPCKSVRFVLYIYANLLCLCGIRPCGSFRPLLEKHGCREVNGKLKQNAPACCAAYSLQGHQSRGCWEVFVAHGPDSRLDILLDLVLPFRVWPHMLCNLLFCFHLR